MNQLLETVILFAKYKTVKMILVFFFLYFIAKRYLLTDNVVKLKEFQQKKVAIAYSLPGTKGNWICFVNSYIVLSFKFSLFLSLFSLSFNVSEKLRWFVLGFLVYPDMHLSSHSLLLQSLQLSFYSFNPESQRNTKTSPPDPCHSKVHGSAAAGRLIGMPNLRP